MMWLSTVKDTGGFLSSLGLVRYVQDPLPSCAYKIAGNHHVCNALMMYLHCLPECNAAGNHLLLR